MSKYNAESFYRAALSSNTGLGKSIAGSTLNVSKVPTLTFGLLTIDPNTPSEEIVEYNGADPVAKTITITKRGINPAATSLTTPGVDYAVAAFSFSHAPLSIISGDVNNLHINQNPDFTANTTITGDITFSGAVVTSKSLRVPSYVDASSRDASIPTPTNGQEVYLVAEGKYTDYTAGVWTDRASGTTPNASEVVAGKVEQATLAEQGTLTEFGSTGAPLFVNPKNLKKVSSGAADENKIPLLDSSGSINDFVLLNTYGSEITESGLSTSHTFPVNNGTTKNRIRVDNLRDFYVNETTFGMKATSSQIKTRTTTDKFVTPAQLAETITISAGTTFTSASMPTSRIATTNYPTGPFGPNGGATVAYTKTFTINGNGTYTLSGRFTPGVILGYAYLNLYKNGVYIQRLAQSYSSGSGFEDFSANITIVNGDIFTFYLEDNQTGSFSASCSNIALTYALTTPLGNSTAIVD